MAMSSTLWVRSVSSTSTSISTRKRSWQRWTETVIAANTNWGTNWSKPLTWCQGAAERERGRTWTELNKLHTDSQKTEPRISNIHQEFSLICYWPPFQPVHNYLFPLVWLLIVVGWTLPYLRLVVFGLKYNFVDTTRLRSGIYFLNYSRCHVGILTDRIWISIIKQGQKHIRNLQKRIWGAHLRITSFGSEFSKSCVKQNKVESCKSVPFTFAKIKPSVELLNLKSGSGYFGIIIFLHQFIHVYLMDNNV